MSTAGELLRAWHGPLAMAAAPEAAEAGTIAYVGLGPSATAPLGTLAVLRHVDGEWSLDPLGPVSLEADAGGITAAPGPAAGLRGLAAPSERRLLAVLPWTNALAELRLPTAGEARVIAGRITGFVGAGGGNPLPAALALHPDGSLYVALFGEVPYRAGTGQIVRVESDGRWQPVQQGLTFPVALAVSPGGTLFALEFASAFDARLQSFAGNSGRLVMVDRGAARSRTIVRDLNYPTAVTFSESGDAYFTENGAFSAAGEGRVLRVVSPALVPR
jgi:hypothetical protein